MFHSMSHVNTGLSPVGSFPGGVQLTSLHWRCPAGRMGNKLPWEFCNAAKNRYCFSSFYFFSIPVWKYEEHVFCDSSELSLGQSTILSHLNKANMKAPYWQANKIFGKTFGFMFCDFQQITKPSTSGLEIFVVFDFIMYRYFFKATSLTFSLSCQIRTEGKTDWILSIKNVQADISNSDTDVMSSFAHNCDQIVFVLICTHTKKKQVLLQSIWSLEQVKLSTCVPWSTCFALLLLGMLQIICPNVLSLQSTWIQSGSAALFNNKIVHLWLLDNCGDTVENVLCFIPPTSSRI